MRRRSLGPDRSAMAMDPVLPACPSAHQFRRWGLTRPAQSAPSSAWPGLALPRQEQHSAAGVCTFTRSLCCGLVKPKLRFVRECRTSAPTSLLRTFPLSFYLCSCHSFAVDLPFFLPSYPFSVVACLLRVYTVPRSLASGQLLFLPTAASLSSFIFVFFFLLSVSGQTRKELKAQIQAQARGNDPAGPILPGQCILPACSLSAPTTPSGPGRRC